MHDQSCHLRNVATYIWNREYWFSICVWYASAASLKYFRKNSSHSCPSPPDHHQFSALIEFRQQDCSEKTKEDEYRYIRANCISRLVSSIILIFCLDNLKYDASYNQLSVPWLLINEKKYTGVIIVDTSMGIQIMLFCVTYLLSTICFSSVAVKSVRGSSQRNNHPPTVRLTSPNEIVITFVVSQRSVSILFISGGVAWLLDTSKLTDISKKAQVYESSIC